MNKKFTQENLDKICYKLLCDVFISGAYSNIAIGRGLNKIPPSARAYVTRVFYGTLEKSIQFDYIISKLTEKSPQRSVKVLLKMGLYLLRYTDTPQYAAIDRIVSLSKEVGKSAVSGFINAVLRKSIDVKIPIDNLSAALSYPQWVIDKLLARYSKEFIYENLSRKDDFEKHIRRNGLKINKDEFEGKLGNCQKTSLGYLVTSANLANLNQDEYTFQSLASMLAVRAYLSQEQPKKVLDLCSAPGGKAIYLKELSPNSQIICCDTMPHRLDLIKKYATRMGTKVELVCADASVLNVEWLNQFDLVICDVPCSGLGVKTKPDVLLNRKQTDIVQLSKLQYDILFNAAKYVKEGGVLCYSTCTFLVEENEDVVNKFLKNNSNFALSEINDPYIEKNNGMVNLYPSKYNSDLFFIARMKRIK